jgi:hypothetical protein
MTLVRNERTKLLANALDRASTACFTVGIATPLAGWLYNVSAFRAGLDPLTLAFGIGGWLFGSIALHLAARRVLGDLQQ